MAEGLRCVWCPAMAEIVAGGMSLCATHRQQQTHQVDAEGVCYFCRRTTLGRQDHPVCDAAPGLVVPLGARPHV